MDEIVRQAMQKWPDVPNAYGWLSLGRRGEWRLKGQPVAHPGVTEFIGRNYDHDDRGRWYFQNGPQRVFVALAITPWILRLSGPATLVTHTGRDPGAVRRVCCTTLGELLFVTDAGAGAVDDRDLGRLAPSLVGADDAPVADEAFARWLEGEVAGLSLHWDGRRWPVERIAAQDVPSVFGFDPDPRPPEGEPEC